MTSPELTTLTEDWTAYVQQGDCAYPLSERRNMRQEDADA